jgi:hypothetical protein
MGGLARDIFVECSTAIAGKPAPTGTVVVCLIVNDIAPTYICIFLRGTAQPHVQVLIA